jgi:hypothetical protein
MLTPSDIVANVYSCRRPAPEFSAANISAINVIDSQPATASINTIIERLCSKQSVSGPP